MTRFLQEWERDLVRGVGTDLMRDLVKDFRRGVPQPKSLAQPPDSKSATPTPGSGWVQAPPIGPPPGIAQLDKLCEAADRADREEWKKRGGPL
jgi:hypothetical protein